MYKKSIGLSCPSPKTTQQTPAQVAKGQHAHDQITLVPQNGIGNTAGNVTRADDLIYNPKTKSYEIFEYKRSKDTKLTPSQKAAQEHVNNGSKTFEVRSKFKRKDGVTVDKGSKVKVEKYTRENKYE